MNKSEATKCIETLLKTASKCGDPESAKNFAVAAKELSIAVSIMIRNGLIVQ